MSIITYPLNGVTYDAEDVSTYLCTRTSGVYAKDTNYAVSVTRPAADHRGPRSCVDQLRRFQGRLGLQPGGGQPDRPGRRQHPAPHRPVVLQFDTAANLTAVKLKPGHACRRPGAARHPAEPQPVRAGPVHGERARRLLGDHRRRHHRHPRGRGRVRCHAGRGQGHPHGPAAGAGAGHNDPAVH